MEQENNKFKRIKTLETTVASLLLGAVFLTFISLFGDVITSTTRLTDIYLPINRKMGFITYITDGYETISYLFQNDVSSSKYSSGLEMLFGIICYITGAILFLVFGIIGVVKTIKYLRGQKAFEYHFIVKAVAFKTIFDLLQIFLFYGHYKTISIYPYSTMRMGWGTILTLLSCLITFLVISCRYVYYAYVLKKDIVIPLLFCISLFLFLLAAIFGSQGQLFVYKDGALQTLTGFNAFIYITSLEKTTYPVISSAKQVCRIASLLFFLPPLLLITSMLFFGKKKKKSNLPLLIIPSVTIGLMIIAYLIVCATYYDALAKDVSSGTDFALFVSFSTLGIALVVAIFVLLKNKGNVFFPQEVDEEIANTINNQRN